MVTALDKESPRLRRRSLDSMLPAVLVAIAGAGCCVTPAVAQSTGVEGAAAESAPRERRWLPFEFYQQKYVYVRGEILGHATDIVLDTGAGKTVVDKTFAELIGLETRGSVTAKGVGGSVRASWAPGVELKLGETEIGDLTAVVIDMGFVRSMLGRDMPVILGVDVFDEMVVDLDYPNRRVAFLAAEGFEYDGTGDTVSLKRQPFAKMWKVPATIDGAEGWFDLDTGSGDTLSLTTGFGEAHGLPAETSRTSRWMRAGVGGVRETRTFSAGTLRIGSTTLTDVPMSVQQGGGRGDSDGNMGAQIFGRFRVICDFSRERIHLEPGPDCETRQFRRERLGIYPDATKETLEVKLIAPGSPAAAAGWTAGMVITAVDGSTGSAHDLLAKIRSASLDAKEIRLRDGDGREHTIALARYY
jgi:hypothetical protein